MMIKNQRLISSSDIKELIKSKQKNFFVKHWPDILFYSLIAILTGLDFLLKSHYISKNEWDYHLIIGVLYLGGSIGMILNEQFKKEQLKMQGWTDDEINQSKVHPLTTEQRTEWVELIKNKPEWKVYDQAVRQEGRDLYDVELARLKQSL